MIIIYIDIILLIILLLLILFACGYSVYRVHRLQRMGQVAILLKPTKVLFSHRKEGESTEELRTVVAYQNPFTGDYCVHKSRSGPKGYENSALPLVESPDSGVSDEYEPLHPVHPVHPVLPVTPVTPVHPQPALHEQSHSLLVPDPVKLPMTPVYDNSVNKTWHWDYTEYQI